MKCKHGLQSDYCSTCLNPTPFKRKIRRFVGRIEGVNREMWLRKVQDSMVYGGRNWKWFEIKLAKLESRERKTRYVRELPLP